MVLIKILDAKCDKGYTLKVASVSDVSAGWQDNTDLIIGGAALPDHMEVTECKSKCDEEPECKAYHYSPKKKRCKLMNVSSPPIAEKDAKNKGTPYEDFVWCSESNYVIDITSSAYNINNQYEIIRLYFYDDKFKTYEIIFFLRYL